MDAAPRVVLWILFGESARDYVHLGLRLLQRNAVLEPREHGEMAPEFAVPERVGHLIGGIER